MKLSEAIERFMTHLRANGRSARTIDAYNRTLYLLLNHCGDIEIGSLACELISEFAASEAGRPGKNGNARASLTIHGQKAALRSFGSYLENADILPRNPARLLSMKRTDGKEKSVFTDLERKRLVKAVESHKGEAAYRDHVMLALFLGTGIRLSELVNLNVSDVDLDNKRISITVKGNRNETRFINTDLRTLLRKYLRKRNSTDSDANALFLSNRNGRISNRQVQLRFVLWLQWAGINRDDLTVHSLRHTFGTRLYDKTRDLVLVGKAMGHRSVEATKVYVHQDGEAMEEALESMRVA